MQAGSKSSEQVKRNRGSRTAFMPHRFHAGAEEDPSGRNSRGAAAGGHLRRCRSSAMTSHRLRRLASARPRSAAGATVLAPKCVTYFVTGP